MAWRESAHITRLKVGKIFSGGAGAWREGPSGKELAGIRSDYTFEQFLHPPIMQNATGAAPAVTDAHVNRMRLGYNYFEKTNINEQTLFMPTLAAGGIDVAGDQTFTDGFEITQGITANDKHAFTIGTSHPFFGRWKFSVAVVAGTISLVCGFRKAEAHQAALAGYANYAGFLLNAGTIHSTVNLATTITSTSTTDTVANTVTVNLEVRVSKAGVVSHLINGKPPTVNTPRALPDALVVVPFWRFFNAAAAVTGAIILQEWEVGYQ